MFHNTLIKFCQLFGFFKNIEVFENIKFPSLQQSGPLVTEINKVLVAKEHVLTLQNREEFIRAIGIGHKSKGNYCLHITLSRTLTTEQEIILRDTIGNVSTEFFALRSMCTDQ